MIDFIKNRDEFEEKKLKFLSLFDKNIDFAENPFKSNFKYYLAFEFDFIYHKHFFEGLKIFMSKTENEKLIFFTIVPSPENFFYKNFKKYSVFEIGINNSDEELNKIMMKNPGGSTADVLAINSNEVAWFSKLDDWGVLGSRDWEMGIVGFSNKESRRLFLSSFDEGKDMFFTIQKQVEIYDHMFEFDDEQRNNYNNLIKNYSDPTDAESSKSAR